MAKQSEVDIALQSIAQKISELERARDIIIASRVQAKHGESVKRTRKRRGMPADAPTNGE